MDACCPRCNLPFNQRDGDVLVHAFGQEQRMHGLCAALLCAEQHGRGRTLDEVHIVPEAGREYAIYTGGAEKAVTLTKRQVQRWYRPLAQAVTRGCRKHWQVALTEMVAMIPSFGRYRKMMLKDFLLAGETGSEEDFKQQILERLVSSPAAYLAFGGSEAAAGLELLVDYGQLYDALVLEALKS